MNWIERSSLLMTTRTLLVVITLAINSHCLPALMSKEEHYSYLQAGGFANSTETHVEFDGERKQPLLTREERSTVSVECCATVTEWIEPWGGVNRKGMYVHLFRQGEKRQRFKEVSCKEGVIGHPCRFIKKRFKKDSQCVQKYLYTNAIISNRTQNTDFSIHNNQWILDSIRIRSGCSCEVAWKKKKRKGRPKQRHKLKAGIVANNV